MSLSESIQRFRSLAEMIPGMSRADYEVGMAHTRAARRTAPAGKVKSYVSDRQGGFYVEYVTPAESDRRERKWKRDYDGYVINPDD